MRLKSYLLIGSAISLMVAPSLAMASIVRDVKVVGSERVEPSTVLTYLSLKKGDDVTQDALDDALKSLFATGLFADVQVSETNGIVTVKVVENPIINEVAFEGNDELEDEKLQGEIQARSRQVFYKVKHSE
jgi:outer membrane protein insertion porin family